MTERHPTDAYRDYAAQQDASYSYRTESRTRYDAYGYPEGWQGPRPVAPSFTGESLDKWKKNNGITSDTDMAQYLLDRGLKLESRFFAEKSIATDIFSRKETPKK
jgi:hypothetical protein